MEKDKICIPPPSLYIKQMKLFALLLTVLNVVYNPSTYFFCAILLATLYLYLRSADILVE